MQQGAKSASGEGMCLWNAFGEFACTPNAFPQNTVAAMEGARNEARRSAAAMVGTDLRQGREAFGPQQPMGYSTMSSGPAPITSDPKKKGVADLSLPMGSGLGLEGFSDGSSAGSKRQKREPVQEGFCGCSSPGM